MYIKDYQGNFLDSYDQALGYVVMATEKVHHDAVDKVEEVGHWETVKEYPNGGKDIEWVVDVPGVSAREAYDEEVLYHLYKPYTKEELERIRNPPPGPLELLQQETDDAICALYEMILGSLK